MFASAARRFANHASQPQGAAWQAKNKDRPIKACVSESQRLSFIQLRANGTALWKAAGVCDCTGGVCKANAHPIQFVANHLGEITSIYESNLRLKDVQLQEVLQVAASQVNEAEINRVAAVQALASVATSTAEATRRLPIAEQKISELEEKLENSLGEIPEESRVFKTNSENRPDDSAEFRETMMKMLGVQDELAKLTEDCAVLSDRLVSHVQINFDLFLSCKYLSPS